MQYENGKVKDINIAYIGGGSRSWAWKLMVDLASEESMSGNVKLYDIDFDAAYNNEIIGNSFAGRDDVRGSWSYKAVSTQKEALAGADVVVISIIPGTFKEMASDVHLPEKYGIYQSVGDTTGPGGLVRAMRTIPMYVEFAENIKKYCPDAWVINYTNPMAICVMTLYRIFPGIKAFGCCYGAFETQTLLRTMLKDMKGIEVTDRKDIKVNVLGINHFTWFSKASYMGIDLMPLFSEFVDKYYNEGYFEEEEHDLTTAHKVQFDLFKKYRLIPAGGDRHIAEFMPPWYLKDPETVKKWRFELTPVEYRVNYNAMLLEKSKRIVSGEEMIEILPSGQEGVKEIKALFGLGEFATNVNMPNAGQVKDIPIGTVVETYARFTKDTVSPMMSGGFPAPIQHLTMRHVYNYETILEASLKKDKELAFSAFINDPQVCTIDPVDARELFEQMLKNTKEYLPGWNI